MIFLETCCHAQGAPLLDDDDDDDASVVAERVSLSRDGTLLFEGDEVLHVGVGKELCLFISVFSLRPNVGAVVEPEKDIFLSFFFSGVEVVVD